MGKKIDWTAISMHPAQVRKQAAAVEELSRAGEDFEITDALCHPSEGGLTVLQMINGSVNGQRAARSSGASAAFNKQYRLRVLSDMWGEPVQPGDAVEWFVDRQTRDHLGQKITSRKIADLKRRGEIRTIEEWHDATVDERGCITVPFADATSLLSNRGMHYIAKTPITGMREKASGPARCPDGVERTQHYWLYEEVPEGDYQKLTDATKVQKRTRRKTNNNQAVEA